MHKLRTIDVWDTLLRRDCHPECIKLATAYHVLLGHYHDIDPEHRSLLALYEARLAAERSLAEERRASGHDDEYEIGDVFAHWLRAAMGTDPDLSLVEELVEFEFSVEVARSYPDDGIEAFLAAHPAETTLFLSDFYMKGSMLRRLLEAKQLGHLVGQGMASCDVGLNKRSGKLYRHLHEGHGVQPGEHIHFGDNQWSDVDAARQLGIAAVHYLPETSHAQRMERESLFASREALFAHVRERCREAARDNAPAASSSAFNAGMDAAPLFIGFALWIAEQTVMHRLQRLCFFTREGEFFEKVFAVLFPASTFHGFRLPPVSVLEVSRISTFTASLAAPTLTEVSRLWSVFGSQSVSGLFATLGLDIAQFESVLDGIGLRPTDVSESPSSDPAFQALFDAPEFAGALEQRIKDQRRLLDSYLSQHGVKGAMSIGMVDVGWRGTIQDNLAMLLPDTPTYGLYLGLRSFVNAQPANALKRAYGPDENESVAEAHLFEAFAAMEMICSSASGSVTGYRQDDTGVVAIRDVDPAENRSFETFTSDFQQGVIFAVEQWQPFVESYVVSPEDMRAPAMAVWETLLKAPADELAAAFIDAPQQDVFGFNEMFSRNAAPSLRTIYLAPISKSRRRELIEFVRRVQWSAAINGMPNLSRFHKTSLLLTFKLANRLKLLRMKMRHKRSR